MSEYLFFRHAEPENQAPGFALDVLRDPAGRADHPLSPRGREQALRAAAAAKAFGAQVVVSSSLLRSRETADIIALELGLPRREDPDLVEVNPGRRSLDPSFAGGRIAAVSLALLLAYFVDRRVSARREGESAADLLARIDRAFMHLAEMPEERIAIVSHGYFIFTSALLITPGVARTLRNKIQHCGSMLVEQRDGRLRVLALDPLAKR